MDYRRYMRALACVVVFVFALHLQSSSAQAAAAAPAFVQTATGYTNSAGTSLGANFSSSVTVGNLIVASTYYNSSSITASCTDSQNNTYATAVYAVSGTVSVYTCYAFASASGALTVNMNWSGSIPTRRTTLNEFSGVASFAPVDVVSSKGLYSGAGSSIASNPVTTTSDGDLVLGVFGASASFDTTPGFSTGNSAATPFVEYTVQSAAGSIVATSVINNSQTWVATLIAFRAVAVERSIPITATVDPAFGFTVAAHSGTCNGFAQTGSATPIAAALGHVTVGTPGTSAQDLTVITNANSGYSVKLKVTGALASGSNSIAAAPGTNVSPAAFPSTGTAAFGYTTSGLLRFTGAWAGADSNFADVMTAASVGSGTATSCVAYKAQVTALTPAGTYSTTVIYAAIPSF